MSHTTLVIASCSQVMQHGINLILGKLSGSIKISAAKNDKELMNVIGTGGTGMLISDGTLPYLCEKGLEPAMQTAQPWLRVAIYCKEKNNKKDACYCLTSKLVYLESTSGIAALQDTITTMLSYLKSPLPAFQVPVSDLETCRLPAFHRSVL